MKECAGYHCAVCGMWVTNWRAHAHVNTEWGDRDKLIQLLERIANALERIMNEETATSPDR